MRAHYDQIDTGISAIADDFGSRVALQKNMRDGDARINGTNLFQLPLPVRSVGDLVALRSRRGGRVRVVDEKTVRLALWFSAKAIA